MSQSLVAPFAPFRSASFGIGRSSFSSPSQFERSREYDRNDKVVSYANAFRSLRFAADSENDVDGTHSSAVVRLSARAKAVEFEDGTLRSKSSAKLRFHYSFDAEDGTRITVRATAKLSFAQQTNSDGSSESIRIKAGYFVSVIQDQVATGVEGLTESVNLPDSVQTVVGQALGLFQQVTETLAGDANTDAFVDGDALITGLVDAFNDFATSFLQPFLGNRSAGEVEGAGAALPPEDVEIPTSEIGAVSSSIDSTTPVASSSSTSGSSSPVEATASDVSSPSVDDRLDPLSVNGVVDLPTNEAESTEDEPASAASNPASASGEEADEPVGTETTVKEATTANAENLRSAAEATLFRIRVSVIQSLTQMSHSLDSEDSTYDSYQSSFFGLAKVDYRSTTFSRLDATAPLIGTSVDVTG